MKVFHVRPSEAVILIGNVMACKDADADADRTVNELMADLNAWRGWVTKPVLESALYCCNMNDEHGQFFDPFGHGFVKFLRDVLPQGVIFDRYYNRIKDRRDAKKEAIPTTYTVGGGSTATR